MSATTWVLLGLGVALGLYALALLALLAVGRRTDARVLAKLVPDRLALARRLLRDPRVPRRHKLLLVLLVAYLASPIDLVPDFIPVAGQLDDLLVAWLVLRAVRRYAAYR